MKIHRLIGEIVNKLTFRIILFSHIVNLNRAYTFHYKTKATQNHNCENVEVIGSCGDGSKKLCRNSHFKVKQHQKWM